MTKRHILLVVLLTALLLPACNTRTDIPPNGDELYKKGETLYIEYCAECHQADGTGWSTLYPKLAGNPIVTLHDPEPIIDTVTYGQGSMMSFRSKLSSMEIAAVLTYIRNSWGNQADPVSWRQAH